MNAFIQIVTFEQGVEQFKLFDLPKCLLGKELTEEKFSWIGLNGKKDSVDSVGKLYAKAGKVKFAQVGYEAKFKSIKVHPKISLKETFGVLQIPSTSALWADAAYWEMGNIPSVYRRARRSRDILETVKRSKITVFPSVFELTLKFASRLSQDEVAVALAEWINESFKVGELNFVTCGVIDFGGSMLFSKMEMFNLEAGEYSLVDFMYRFVLGTPLLKERLDRLHPLQIHNRKTIYGLSCALGLSAPIDLGDALSILLIPKAMLNDVSLNRKAAKFLIPRDDTTSWAGLVKRGE